MRLLPGWPRLLLAVYLVLFLAAHLAPLRGLGAPGRTDLAAHFLMYLVLGLLVGRALAGDPVRRMQAVLVVGLLLGAATEAAQTFIPSRSGDLSDFAADLAGTIVAALWVGARARAAPSEGSPATEKQSPAVEEE